MLDEAHEVTSTESVETPTESSEPTWWIDDNLPGVGDRPEWLPEKFKTISDMSKSYSELEKRFGTAPKEYDFSKAEGWLDVGSDIAKNIAAAAKEKGVPQDFMDTVLENIGQQLQSETIDFATEKAKLGDNADERLSQLNTFYKSKVGEDAFKALADSMQTAESIMALEKVMDMVNDNMTKVPGDNESSSGGETLEEIQQEISKNFEKYKEDPKYRAEMQRKFEKVAAGSGYTEKTTI